MFLNMSATATRTLASLVGLGLMTACPVSSPEPAPIVDEVLAAVPTPPPAEPRGAIDVCVGGEHSCAIREAGKVYCWGDNLRHQVSTGDFAQTSRPTVVPGLPEARRMICDADVSCMLSTADEVWCWGRVAGLTATAVGPTRVPLSPGVRDFVLTRWGGCAVYTDGEVRCIAAGSSREVLAPGIAGATGFVPAEPERLCVARTAGPTICFQAGPRVTPKARAEAPPAAPGEPIVFSHLEEVASLPAIPPPHAPPGTPRLRVTRTSATHACGLDDVGDVFCWGRASAGQLGDLADYLHGPARVPELDDAVSLAVGEAGACAARRSGSLLCWGRLADDDPPLPPRAVDPPFDADAVALGASLLDAASVCARDRATRGWRCRFGAEWLTIPARFLGAPKPALIDERGGAWHLNLHGPPTRDFFFSQVGVPIAAIAHDGYCAVDTRGRIVCGHCGACDRPRDALTTITVDEPFVRVGSLTHDEVHDTTVCGLTIAGRTLCHAIADAPFRWAEPRRLELEGLPGDAVDIAASGGRYAPNLTCVRTRGGDVHCFGDARHAQHDGSADRASKIAGLPAVVELGVGGSFACAREEAGGVWCWGSDRDGGAANGLPLERPEGVRVRFDAPVR